MLTHVQALPLLHHSTGRFMKLCLSGEGTESTSSRVWVWPTRWIVCHHARSRWYGPRVDYLFKSVREPRRQGGYDEKCQTDTDETQCREDECFAILPNIAKD